MPNNTMDRHAVLLFPSGGCKRGSGGNLRRNESQAVREKAICPAARDSEKFFLPVSSFHVSCTHALKLTQCVNNLSPRTNLRQIFRSSETFSSQGRAGAYSKIHINLLTLYIHLGWAGRPSATPTFLHVVRVRSKLSFPFIVDFYD